MYGGSGLLFIEPDSGVCLGLLDGPQCQLFATTTDLALRRVQSRGRRYVLQDPVVVLDEFRPLHALQLETN